jgi:MFS family permease
MIASALVPVMIASALTAGGVLALAANLREPLAERLNLSQPQSRRIASALALILVPLLPLAGLLVDSLGVEHVMIGGAVLAALGFSLLALRDSFPGTMAALLIIGAAAASLAASTTALLAGKFFPGRPTAALCLGYAVIGLGSVLFPLLADLALPSLRWRRGLLLLALLFLLPALVAALTPPGEFPQERPLEGPRLMHSGSVWLGGLICFLYLPMEAAVTSFATTQMTSLGFTNRQAASLRLGFWTAFLGARLVAMMFVLWGTIRPGKEGWVVFGLGLAAAVAIGNLAGAAGKTNIGWGVLLAGFFFGPIYPVLLGCVLYRFSDEPGAAFGVVAGLGALGALLATPLLAAAARRATPQRTLRVPLMLALLLAGAAMVLGLTA